MVAAIEPRLINRTLHRNPVAKGDRTLASESVVVFETVCPHVAHSKCFPDRVRSARAIISLGTGHVAATLCNQAQVQTGHTCLAKVKNSHTLFPDAPGGHCPSTGSPVFEQSARSLHCCVTKPAPIVTFAQYWMSLQQCEWALHSAQFFDCQPSTPKLCIPPYKTQTTDGCIRFPPSYHYECKPEGQ